MSEFSRTVVGLFSKREAPDQGGLLSGKDPSAFNSVDPLRLWIIQVGVIVMMTQLLALALRKMRQPKVIAEVLGGIILGPTAFGRIPGFTKHVFPEESRPYLSLVANIGLCLFLFLVGLEIESSVIKRNWRLSATVALAGMVLPFGLGAGLAVPLYHQFIDPSIKFTNFMLFTGVAYSITAFPVLCRILTELKLLDTTVGIVVLSAGVGNDIIGWTLLALSVALVNGGAGLTALYILLICVAWALFLLFVVSRLLYWLARKTGSLENGPSMFFMTITILLLFGSAFFTDVIGVHAIFGAFLAGIIVPREGGLAIHLTEKLEDMVTIIFLPLYFTLSGLSTDLGTLNNGITWGYTIAICALAYFGKFGGCTVAARYAGFSWREASTIGSLMSCKGLVELIVLNVGLSAGILTTRVFSMFVLEALLLTFMTTPAVTLLYPPERRVRASAEGANFANVGAGGAEGGEGRPSREDEDGWKSRYTVVLDKLEHVPGMMALTQLLQRPGSGDTTTPTEKDPSPPASLASTETHVDALRLIELSDRTSAVMNALDKAADTIIHTDPLLAVFRMYGELHDLAVSTSLNIVDFDSMAAAVTEHAKRMGSHLILVPWLPPHDASTAVVDHSNGARTPRHAPTYNPFDMLMGRASTTDGHPASALHSEFVRGIFAQSTTDVALFVDRGNAPGEARTARSRHHIYVPFFGGPDDRLALDLAVQLCANPKTSATVVRCEKRDVTPEEALRQPEDAYLGEEAMAHLHAHSKSLTVHSTVPGIPDTVYGGHTTQTRLQSETADNVAWDKYASHIPSKENPSTLSAALSRIEFLDLSSPKPVHAILGQSTERLHSVIEAGERLLVLVGRSRRLAVEDHQNELKELMDEHGHVTSDVRKTIGDVATAFVASHSTAGLVVVQAALNQS